jgi:hypothetical protein
LAISPACRSRARGVLLLREPQQVRGLLVPAFEIAIFGGPFGLRVEPGQLRSEFDADVFDGKGSRAYRRCGSRSPAAAHDSGYARGLFQKDRSSSGRAPMTRAIMPCSMIA